MLMTSDPGDLVLDPTCGSGTTAFVAEQLGRRWITTDTSRVALALARTRLMAGRYPSYLLRDSQDGAAKEGEITGRPSEEGPFGQDIRQGFVLERVPHVTLKSIANNAEIDVIQEKWAPKVEAARVALNAALRTSHEEWQVPRTLPEDAPQAARDAHAARSEAQDGAGTPGGGVAGALPAWLRVGAARNARRPCHALRQHDVRDSGRRAPVG
jgi:adenine-specific DNA-methyltransferase